MHHNLPKMLMSLTLTLTLMFCYDILVVDCFNLIVDLYSDVVDYLFSAGIVGVIVMVDISVAIVPSSISPPISVTGGTSEALVLHRLLLPILLGISAL